MCVLRTDLLHATSTPLKNPPYFPTTLPMYLINAKIKLKKFLNKFK